MRPVRFFRWIIEWISQTILLTKTRFRWIRWIRWTIRLTGWSRIRRRVIFKIKERSVLYTVQKLSLTSRQRVESFELVSIRGALGRSWTLQDRWMKCGPLKETGRCRWRWRMKWISKRIGQWRYVRMIRLVFVGDLGLLVSILVGQFRFFLDQSKTGHPMLWTKIHNIL